MTGENKKQNNERSKPTSTSKWNIKRAFQFIHKWRKPKIESVHNITEANITKEGNTVKENSKRRKRLPFIRSVGGRILLTFFICTVTLVLVSGQLFYSIAKDVIQTKVSEAYQQTVASSGDKLGMIYEKYESLSMQFIANHDIRNGIIKLTAGRTEAEREAAIDELDGRLQAIMLTEDQVKGIHILDINGDHLYSQGSQMTSGNYTNEDWFERMVDMNRFAYWVPTQKGGYSEQTRDAFGITRLVKDTSNNNVAMIFLEIRVDALYGTMNAIELGEDGEVFILAGDEQIIATRNSDLIGENYVHFDAEHTTFVDDDDVERLQVYHKSDVNYWTIIGTVSVNELVKDARQIFYATLIIAGIAAVIAILIGIVIARSVGVPLRKLTALMEEGADGNLSIRANFKNKDEIGRVGQSFDRMMGQISSLVEQTNESASEVLSTATWLADVSKQTSLSAREISAASEEIAGGATTLAAEAERGNELTQDISSQMGQVIEANVEMGQSAHDVQQSSERGTLYMDQVIEKTNQTEDMTREMVNKVDQLKDNTSSIRKILELLDGITRQTNILSLNATIEAARAGAAGKGFMVVADEIRKLADQSKESISVVGEITDSIQQEINETVQVLSEAYPIFQEQTESVKEADEIFKQVQNKMGGFIHHLDGVTDSIQHLEESQEVLTDAMSNVSAVSEESSATSEEVASLTVEQIKVSEGLVKLAQELEDLSHSLQESLNRFKI